MHATPLRDQHLALGARMVSFGGWEMPVRYGSILEEARNVRTACGLFDLCHMGRVEVEGPDAEALCQKVVTNDVARIKPGAIRYALLTRHDGGVLDDILVYRDPDDPAAFFVVVNATNREQDLAWLRTHGGNMDCRIVDRTFDLAMIALQGPRSEAILQELCDADLAALGYYKWTHARVSGLDCTVSRTGYTGEDGFEIYYPVASAAKVWNAVVEAGRPQGLQPTGLGARDTLRLEAGMALYGHELTQQINPYEAGLAWAVKLGTDFVGREALAEVAARGPARRLVGLVTESRRVPRPDYEVVHAGKTAGWIASGTFSPHLGCNIATAYLTPELAAPGTEVGFRVGDKEEPATVRALPFYERAK